MGVWSGSIDGYDDRDLPMDNNEDGGYAATYHAGPDWSGPEGFYVRDFRKPMTPAESKTWVIYLWADPDIYDETRMTISVEAGAPVPPAERTYSLELLYVPDGISNAPPLGTTWELVVGETLMVEVPTYKTDNGLAGYQFAFTASAVPEPASLRGLLGGRALLRRR